MRLSKLLLALVFLLASCSQDELTTPNGVQSDKMEQYAKIVDMACESYNAINSCSRFSNSVTSVYPWLKSDIYSEDYMSRGCDDELPDTLLYIVNFSNNSGSVIVSDNDLFKGIVAIIDEGNINPKDNIDIPDVRFYLNSFREALKTNKINQTTDYSDIAEYIQQPTSVADADTNWITSQLCPPLINAKWGQGNPYNKYCFTSEGNQAVAGCGPIALAQILTYYKYPNSILDYTIQWQHLTFTYPTTWDQADNVGKFVHAIGRSVNASYGETATGTSQDVILDFFLNHGFEATESSGFSNENGVHNIKEYGPFFMSGFNAYAGHGWAIDGVHIQTKTINGETSVRFLFHCNWGWNGSYNGYFLSSAFDPYCDGINPNDYHNFNYWTKKIGFIRKKQ